MIIHFETSDFRFVDDDTVLGIFGLEISEGASGGQSAREDSQWTSDGIVETIRHFSDSGGLVDLSAGLDDALLLIRVGGLVVFGHLVALVEFVTG